MKAAPRVPPRAAECGMTLVEVLISLMLLVAFMGVYVAVTESINRFFAESEAAVSGSQGLLADRYSLMDAMDRLADSLSQPAIDQSDIKEIIDSPAKVCTYDPVLDWALPGEKLLLPKGSSLCLRQTSLVESSYSDLVNKRDFAKPGIYLIQAVPDEDYYSSTGSSAAQSARRIFCRPKPFCDYLQR
jgi:hypothetical protein